MDEMPQAVAWFVDEPIADDDPLAAVKRRARWHCDPFRHVDLIDQAADMFGDWCFDVADTYDAAEAAGLPEPLADAAAYIALTLRQIEVDG